MNFFQRQTSTRRLLRLLVVLFTLAVIVVILAVDLVVLTLLANAGGEVEDGMPMAAWITQHPGALLITSACVFAIIALSSLYKTATLWAGGGVVARSLGGVRVSQDTKDPAQRRLLNVVEEMSIASGVSMPEVYLLEHERGINAFAAGHTPANAAVAVTRGALDTLKRDELQGVIAHEFSHILNGDMRLNIRLMGLLFGLLVIALIARTVLRYGPRSRDKKGGAAAIMLAAVAVWLIGSVGLFCGRLIQAAVSRSREALADASAVQFTRDPQGIRAALVKIGAIAEGSRLGHPEVEEVAHMLFAPGMSRLFATHPPLLERLRAIDPHFQPSEFAQARAALEREQAGAPVREEKSSAERLQDVVNIPVTVTPASVVQLMGNPGTAQMQLARDIRRSLPPQLVSASQQPVSARALLLGLAVARDAQTRDLQLRYIEQQAGAPVRQSIDHLIESIDALEPMQRLPLLTRAFPALRQLPRTERQQLMATLNCMLVREGRLTLSVYALRKLAQVQLRDEMMPPVRTRQLPLSAVRAELRTLFSVLAREGHADEQIATEAFEAGMRWLGVPTSATFAVESNWPPKLDLALNRLDLLQPAAKQLLVEALVKAIAHDQQLAVTEAELLRAVCASLHCPLPPLVAAE
jgi:Zn-dependent protease with chaperone function